MAWRADLRSQGPRDREIQDELSNRGTLLTRSFHRLLESRSSYEDDDDWQLARLGFAGEVQWWVSYARKIFSPKIGIAYGDSMARREALFHILDEAGQIGRRIGTTYDDDDELHELDELDWLSHAIVEGSHDFGSIKDDESDGDDDDTKTLQVRDANSAVPCSVS